jgi:hypothetical protein
MLVQTPRLSKAGGTVSGIVSKMRRWAKITHVYAIKQVVRVIFVVLEDLEYLLVYGDLVVSVWVDYVLLLRKSKML